MSKKKIQKSILLSKDILYFPGHANIVVLNLGTKSLLIDCGRNLVEAGQIRREAESIFKNKIEYVILTHLHSDHTHSLPLYSDCQIIASKLLTKYLIAAKRKPVKYFPLVYPNIIFDEEYTLKESDWEILVKQTGGHTPDSTYIYSQKHKLLAVGDNLRSDFLWGGRQSDPEKWILALEEYISFDLEHIIIGHGDIFTKKEVQEILIYIIDVKKVIGDLLEGDRTNEEIIQRVKDVKPRGKFGVFIHDDTIIKWYEFWKKKKKRKKS